MKERPVARQAIFNSFNLPDEHSFGVYKALQDLYPSFAKKIFNENPLMHKLVLSGYNPMDVLDYPICGKCETLAAPSGEVIRNGKRVQQCTCVNHKCGHTTTNPVTCRVWMQDELKRKAPEDFFDTIDFVVDAVAARWIQSYWHNVRKDMERHRAETKAKMDAQNQIDEQVETISKHGKVQHLGLTDEPQLPKDTEHIDLEIEDGGQNEG